MNKFVLVTDTHLGYKNGNIWWLDLTESLFDEIIDYCVRNDVYKIVHLGDWYDDRKSLSIPVIDRSIKICKKLEKNGIHLYVIKGNHDQYYVNVSEPTSLTHLENSPNITVVSKEPFEIFTNMYLVPWGYPLVDIPEKSTIFGHFEINGFTTNYSGRIQEGSKLNKKDFDKFLQVYSGHFHLPSKDGNIDYIGSPYQMNFNDIGSSRGYYIYDDGYVKFIEFTSAPKFVRIHSLDEIIEENVSGNFVEFVFTEDFGSVKNDKIIQDITLLNPHKLYIDYKIDRESVDEMNEEDIEVTENSEIFRTFIEKKKLPNINKTILYKFLEKLEEGL